jgi:uncharacterized membrane protein YhaH (DUF805 family)
MGAWIERHFAWHGLTSRAEYRRWLPLIILAEMTLLAGLFWFGERGMIHFDGFGWPGILLFAVALAYSIAWLFLTARRLRAAGISRAWLIFAVMTYIFPIGSIYINGPIIASLLLTAVGAAARDRREMLIT